ncbi:MAG: DUF1800 domain-containing protein [Bacteroidota bacterium]
MPIWNIDTAKHLLSRTLFGYTRKDLDYALTFSTLGDFIDNEILKENPIPIAPDAWINEIPIPENATIDGQRYRGFNYWWFDLMLKEKTNMREKMVLFLHNHFTSQRTEVQYPQNMYAQQALFRKYAFGNLRQLTKEITIDPAMLIYLNGNRSKSKNAVPNENYAREVMELFTLGAGNYTENDIKEAAKSFAGWVVNGLEARFDPNRVAIENKTILGKTGNFTYDQTIDILFEQPACAPFICRKIYNQFVTNQPNEIFIGKMAKVLRDNDFNLKPLLSFLLKSEEFYASELIGSKIKSPIELMIGSMKILEFSNPAIKYDDVANSDYAYIYDTSKTLQQQLFEPPNVAGWPGQRDWVSSTTYAYRNGFSDSLINGKRLNGAKIAFKLSALDYSKTFLNSENAIKFIDEVTSLFFPLPLSAYKKKLLLETLLEGTIAENYNTNVPMAELRLQKLYKAMMRLPEFQLN